MTTPEPQHSDLQTARVATATGPSSNRTAQTAETVRQSPQVETGSHEPSRLFRPRALGALALLALVLAGVILWWSGHAGNRSSYTTATVDRGTIARAVTATGTVNPVLTVVVGSYVSGVIQDIYCDFNTTVHKGQICARIDPRPYQLAVQQNQADVNSARAQLNKDRANLDYAHVQYGRLSQLLAADSTSRDSVDAARSALNQAEAQIAVDRATIGQRLAALDAAKVSLGYTNIISPVNGTVVSRNVTIGQTVASSFQTPTLFLIAQDLTKMQVDTNVSESDIESETHGIQVGDTALFTVEAFPNWTFRGVVSQVRQAPQTVQNVVTYDVVVSVDNPALRLRPGMTATVRIITQQQQDALRVPNAALRFNPGGLAALATERGPSKIHRASIWVLRNGKAVAVSVTPGVADADYTQILRGDLKPGDKVITGETESGRDKKGRSPEAAARAPRL
ncbi:MAG TPA: efflux RND transporter periplasmic adaptor subunit [Sphingomicrobium sp.]|nr:efflux RND transporter periplasmic adaptor subunit [Sphingomicrobium sp.]